MKNLIIVESPTKAKTLTKFLGRDYVAESTRGHIKDLPKSKLSVDMANDFEPNYMLVKDKAKQVKKLIAEAKKADNIFIATDPDREGEAIAQHTLEVLQESDKKLNISRIVFHEITKEAVEKAISSPGKVDENLVNAQIARRVLDRVVGYKFSPILWKKVRRGLSAGRVQTVTVRLIVEREKEIKAFNADEYWEFYSHLKRTEKKELVVKLVKINEAPLAIDNKSKADETREDLVTAPHKVTNVINKQVNKSPYAPFRTSTLTQVAARFYYWPAKRTMSAAQKLYEEGYITYHRTDSTNIAKGALDMVRKYIEKKYGKEYLPDNARFYKTKSKVAQEAHEAIRPTKVNKEKVSITARYGEDAEKLYKLIWERFVSSQMAESIYDQTRIEITAKGQNIYLLRAAGQTMKFDGWRKVLVGGSAETILPVVVKGEEMVVKKVDAIQKFTQPPPRYNEASLIKKLEELEIGRPSTYAPIISTIQARSYVEKEEGRFYPTPVGFAVNDFLLKNFDDVFDYAFTAKMENDLDDIANGKVEWNKPIKDFWGPMDKILLKVEKNAERVKIETPKLGRKCSTCKEEKRTGKNQGELVIRTGRFGKFISCEKFPDCKHTEPFVVKINMKCPKCETEGRTGKKQGDVVIKKTKRGRKFFGCNQYPDCDFASWKNPSIDREPKG